MYKISNPQKTLFTIFDLSKIDIENSNNRWVVLSMIVLWEKLEERYAKPFRVALGSLIIKERMNLSNEETVNQIMENPFLQYFLGFTTFQYEKPFNSSMMTHFRQRLTQTFINEINEIIIDEETKKSLSSEEDEMKEDKSYYYKIEGERYTQVENFDEDDYDEDYDDYDEDEEF